MVDDKPNRNDDIVLDDEDRFARALQQEHEQLLTPSRSEESSDGDEFDPELSSRVRPLLPVLELLEQYKTSDESTASRRIRTDASTPHEKNATVDSNLTDAADSGPRSDYFPNLQEIGAFRILSQLGRGGYGIVLRAYDPQLDRDVAIKLPKLDAALSSASRQRFRHEAKAAAALSHPGIVSVYETGSERGIDYIVTEFIEGENLATLISQGKRPSPRAAADLVRQLADALAHAHERGILHRDIKPSNILIASEKPLVAKVTDFGLATIADQIDVTQTGDLVGTPAYMSPEQAGGRRNDFGPATDVYGLGAVLYQCLTGVPPFTGSTIVETVRAITDNPPESIRHLDPSCPQDLESICMKCLEKEPAKRYATATELADDLRRYLNHEPIMARPIRHRDRLVRWCRRNPVVSSLSAAVLVLIITLASGSTIAALTLADAQRQTLDSLEKEILAKDRATQSEEDAIATLYEARLALASARRTSGLPGQRFESLQSVRDAAKLSPRLQHGEQEQLRQRNEAIAAFALVDLRVDKQWPGVPPLTAGTEIGLDASVERYARLEAEGRIVVRHIEDNRELLNVSGLGSSEEKPYTRFSKTGRWLAVCGYDAGSVARLQLWDLQNPDEIALDEPIAGPAKSTAFDFSFDDSTLAFALPGGDIRIVDLATMETSRTLDLEVTPARLRFNPDATMLAVVWAGNQSSVFFVDAASGKVDGKACVHPRLVNNAAWNRDGRLLATACDDQNVYVWNTETREQLAVCRGHQHVVNQVAFAHNSDLLMSTSLDMTTRLWEPITGRQLLKTHGRGTALSPDDRWLGFAYVGVSIGRWEVDSSSHFFVLPGTGPASFAYSLAYSPDSRLLAVAGQTSGTGIWDVRSRREVARLPEESASVAFAADGSSLSVGGRGNGIGQWPIESDADAALRFGPPKTLFTTRYWKSAVSLDSDHRKAVVNLSWDTAAVLDLQTGRQLHRLRSPDIRFHAISPDGRFIATGSWRSSGVKVWDAGSGQMIRELPVKGSARVTFSPDGRWLATCAHDGYAFWEVGTWQRTHQGTLESYSFRSAAFSHDGSIAAVSLRSGVKLLDPVSGKEYATLLPPEDFTARCLALSPDGRRLAVGSQEGAIYVWRLDQLRGSLDEMGLDWNQDPISRPADEDDVAVDVDVAFPPFASSSVYNEKYVADLAFDGSTESRWNSARGDGQRPWIARFWPETTNVKRIVIHEAFDRIEGIRIQQLTSNPQQWSDVKVVRRAELQAMQGSVEGRNENDETVNPVFDITLPKAITTRGIRILLTSSATTVSIWEVELE